MFHLPKTSGSSFKSFKFFFLGLSFLIADVISLTRDIFLREPIRIISAAMPERIVSHI